LNHSDNSQLGVKVLVGISALETLAIAGITAVLVVDLFVARADSLVTAVFLTALVGAFAFALALITKGLWDGKSSARSASLVWQVLQGAVGLASAQGHFARIDLALLIGVPAVVAIGLILFNKGVRTHFGG
jgi:hypothetical protein